MRTDSICKISDTVVTYWVELIHPVLAKLNLSRKLTNDQQCADLIMNTLPSGFWNMLR